ncbi:acetylornithine deacetylase/succinyldiaminopimelate desuccinylase-like deacylase [Bernardetia litoralis DSM 6794]|uniref:Acetylornithine deacetylase/succinyldiaminopimelate desuccinylase-like deacylase n=1 Tax=Bernardetia litoralis (strain ATCC 23117 / DSM 6794 / NBRC 15988 / NCIMB 1366 / Fx l1 / Sio-4) TaxID=880071 RepID=I4AQ53_BERLS|nr:dipeptidase [Bernardetia litoralis]AFM06088.1 acetylornithine deacetylase/succinyldiaminopimelate desuccinylase-like deacylase [Bernardetia litoralis DSM 6794]
MNTHDYIEKNKERFLEELKDLLRIPSVSADPKYKEDVFRAGEFIKTKLEEAGADKVELCQTAGYPIVYGEKIIDASLPTVLVYGHYDVQPPDPLELWETPPFEPTVRDEKIYARGACDDKGQMYMHVKAFEAMMKTDTLPCNVKFMIEGEEEVGSDNLGIFVQNNKEKLAADVILISDTGMIANDIPSVTVGLRGLSYVEVEVTGPNRDLHSGLYGGAVPNPINVLCDMIASLKDEDDRITVDNFYDDVAEVSAEERAEMAKAPFSLEEYKNSIGLKDVEGEKGYSTLERASIRPTLDVNGIWGGYTGEGAKTVIASKAYAKISMRLVPNQDSETITKLFKKHFEKIAPDSVSVVVKPHHGGEPIVTPTNSQAYQAASFAYKQTFDKDPIPMRGGGSIPIVAMFKSELGIDSILMGFGLDSDAIHSPNEHYGLFNFYKGINTIPHFFFQYTKIYKPELV